MFGKKKPEFPGLPVMYYEGLPGFDQNFQLYLKQTEEGLIFFKPNSTVTATLPYSRLLNFEFIPERDYLLKYHSEAVSTSKIKLEKRFIVIHYKANPEPKRVVLWGLQDKKLSTVRVELETAFKKSIPESYIL